MLGRARFDLSSVSEIMESDKKECSAILGGKELLFSPYQTLEYSTVNSALDIEIISQQSERDRARKIVTAYQKELSRTLSSTQVALDKKVRSVNRYVTRDVQEYTDHVKALYERTKRVDQLVEIIVEEHINDKKTEFYPLVETLFRIIGVDCHKSRDGVNGERWDAMIRDPQRSIPIEIKSPTEEMHLSIKAIRQALENKIILLSRETYATTEECSTYAVGYYPPNDRAEVIDLISNIKDTFGYSIAVFDIASLIKVTANIILFGRGIDTEKLYGLEGIVNVTDIESRP